MRFFWVLLAVMGGGCKRQSSPEEQPPVRAASGVGAGASLRADLVVDAAVAVVAVDAAPVASAQPTAEQRLKDQREAARFLAVLGSSDPRSAGDMSKRSPGADLGQQLKDIAQPGTVQLAGVTVNGQTSAGADADLARRLAPIKRCYQKGLALDTTLKGELSFELVVGDTGQVTRATVSDTGQAVFESCLVGLLGSIRFTQIRELSAVTGRIKYQLAAAGGTPGSP